MDSGMQSPAMANQYFAPDPSYPGLGSMPLAGSMHAVVPHSFPSVIPHPQSTELAMSHQFDNRVNRLEQQQFQDGVNAHFRGFQMSQSLQHLQQQFHQMQQAIRYDIPALRLQIQTLEAKLDRKENVDCTRQIQLKPRSKEQKVQSAMRNANLMRIFTKVSMHENATLEQNLIYKAEQMETLAASLRGRVHRGGVAYLLEAEDAEAWAGKLRQDARNIELFGVDNMLLENKELESTTAKPPYTDIDSYLNAENAKLEAEKTRNILNSVRISVPTQNTTDMEVAAPAQPASVKDSVHTDTPTFQPSALSNTSISAVSIKIEETSESNGSSVKAGAVSEPRGRKLAPHLRYAVQQVPASKDLTLEFEDTTNNNITQTQEVKDAAEAQVPSKKTLPPHRRLLKRATTPTASESETPSTLKSDTKSTNREVEESTASGVVVPRAVSDIFKDLASSVQNKTFSIKAVPATKSKRHNRKRNNRKKNDSISPLNLTTSIWQPTYLKDLPLLPPSELQEIPSSQKMHTYSRTFLLNHLGGTKWLPSFYHIPTPELSLLPNRGFYLFEDTAEPLAPSSPGSHGSLVTPILRLPDSGNGAEPKPEAMHNAPLFIKKGERYVYFGMYTHLRSDRLDLERCNTLIPEYLKEHWATQLTHPNRPKWVTSALQHHLLAPPSFSPPSSSSSSDAANAHHQALSSWHRDTSLLTSFLRPSHILDAFAAPETGAEIPGLRFWCLGLKCEGWDKGFYEMMEREEKVWEKEGRRDGEREREERREMLRVLGKGAPVKW
jgi:hypothetical protein